MKTQLVIDKWGVTGAAGGTAPPDGGLLVTRNRKQYAVALAPDASCAALVALLSTIRAINNPIDLIINTDTFSFPSSKELCLDIVRRALAVLESIDASPFASQLEIANPALLLIEETPDPLMKLCKFSGGGMDTPSILLALNQLGIENMCVIGLNRAMRYCLVKAPAAIRWPAISHHANRPLQDELDAVTGLWFTSIFEAALSIRKPLHHYGTIQLGSGEQLAFQRILYPIAPSGTRPINFRIATVASTPTPDTIIM